MKKLTDQLNAILAKHAFTRVNGRVASDRTAHAMGVTLRTCFRQLRELGYRLENPANIKESHVAALCAFWHRSGKAPKTIQGYLSGLRIFFGWINKPCTVKSVYHYLPDVPKGELIVRAVATKSKSWSESGIDVAQKLRDADDLDWRFGMMLRLQLAFGLRRMEAVQCMPWKNDLGTRFAAYATKGGRPRDISIDTVEQRQVMDLVKSRVKKSESLGWPTMRSGKPASLAYSMKRYTNLLPKIGISRKDALVTGHGLRAQYAENAALIMSMVPPTLGGTGGQMDKESLNLARSQVSELLGHSRISVTPSYYGSFGRNPIPDAPNRMKETVREAVAALPRDLSGQIPRDRMKDCLHLTGEMAELDVQITPHQAHALWQKHSERHATDWASLQPSNATALEVAAMRLLNKAPQANLPGQ